MATIQYEYGLTHIHSGALIIDEQISLAHKYYNRLIAIEMQRRAESDAALLPYTKPIQELEAETKRIGARLEELTDALAQLRATARKRVKTPPEIAAEIKMLKTLRKPMWDRLRELRAVLKEETRPPKEGMTKEPTQIWLAVQPIWARAHAATLTARAECGLYSGTYQIVEAAAKAAKRSPELSFKKWTGSGTVGSQVTMKLSTRDVFSPNTRIIIDPVDPAAWVAPRGAALGPRPETERPQRLKRRTRVQIRIDSEDRKPVWATFSMMMHRPLPEKAVLTWVKVQRMYVAGRYIWKLLLTMNVPDALPVTDRPTIGIDLGWRKRPDGMRAAAWVSSTGSLGTLVLPQSIQDRLDKADSIRSFRDRETDTMREKLSAMLKKLVLPEPLRAEAKNLHLWKSGKRFERLLWRWYSHRCAGDAPALALLEAWQRRRMHLWQYERGMRAGALCDRRDLFRSFACCVAQTHGVVAIEDWNMTTVVEHPEPEEDDPATPVSRRQRVVTGASLLRLALISAVHQAGGTIMRVPVELTTLRCSYCGVVNNFDKKILEHTCTACKVTWDQDYNAARNLLAGASTGAVQPKASERKAAFASRHKPDRKSVV